MLHPVPTVAAIADVRAAVAAARAAGRTVGFVPTMGALHEGHAALVRAARRETGFVVVSIFVNPTQFGPNEDLPEVPADARRRPQGLRRGRGRPDLRPDGRRRCTRRASVTFVEVTTLGDHLCGPSRPGHFRGVCTVVLKLFNIVQPDVAVFGAKDAQQARIIRQMVRDLNVPVDVRVEPTVREPDGLAMSSRNRYLAPDQRAAAPRIYQALRTGAGPGRSPASATRPRLEAGLRGRAGRDPRARVDYARIVDADTLQPLARLDRPALAAVAVFLGTTRLIDNVTIP